MKDRALRRHQNFRAKQRDKKNYNSCIGDDLPNTEKQTFENNIEKLKKVCVMSHMDKKKQKEKGKTVQELRHDITMKEEVSAR